MSDSNQHPAPRRQPAVHSIDEFVMSVPDLSVAEQFYRSFGLDVRSEEAGLGLYTYGNAHRWGLLHQGPRKQLLWLTFGIYAEDYAAFENNISALGVQRMTPPLQADQNGIWFEGPDRLAVQLRIATKCSPSKKSLRKFPAEHSNRGRAPRRSEVVPVRPNHLSHILLFASDVDASRAFYANVLGLKLSDHAGSIIAFMHSQHGSDHHLLALAKSDGGGLHHTSWDVSSLDDVAHGSEQMARAGYVKGWGLGRHVLGSNYFRYVRDPWGSFAEYSFDIDFIPQGVEWPAADYPPEDSLYVWGPDVPEDFIVNHEL